MRRAILAFNAMGARVSAMFDEKDRMLGAIGHDLRTPLASLRIRAESVEPEAERAKMIATIEEMTAMLDDTLALARSGRAAENLRPIDISALADTVVEEFRVLGHDVRFEEGRRQTAAVQPSLLRRAVRNLVDNAVKYGGSAEVAVRKAEGGGIAVEVADKGPGIPEAALASVQEPFVRLETSRNRETGGSGLGLALARAAAQAHGGRLELENRPGGGLLARIVLEPEQSLKAFPAPIRERDEPDEGRGEGRTVLRYAVFDRALNGLLRMERSISHQRKHLNSFAGSLAAKVFTLRLPHQSSRALAWGTASARRTASTSSGASISSKPTNRPFGPSSK